VRIAYGNWSPEVFDEYMAAGSRFAGSIEEMASNYFRRRDPSSTVSQEDR
jgi:hypothetical protein